MSRPVVQYRMVRVPQNADHPEAYEDAAATHLDDWPICAAVADGATESMYAKQWAQTIVRGLVHQEVGTSEGLRTVASTIRESFHNRIDKSRESEPWYVAAKATEGAYATTLAVLIERGGTWSAVSVGDCCLFHAREGQVQTVWPVASSEAFDHHPALFSSRSPAPVPRPESTTGDWAAGDSFLLATDAVAQWLLRKVENGALGADLFRGETENLEQTLISARDRGALRSDDVTLLTIDMAEPAGDASGA